MITDSIGDMLTRIRNACMAKKATVLIPYSHLNVKIAEILQKEAFIEFIQFSEDSKYFILHLKYRSNINNLSNNKKKIKQSCITNLERISKPGLRIYTNNKEIPKFLGGTGILILSTPKGVLKDRDARSRGVGGEILCSIW
nr:ribosomal protein S8 [Elakatothrix viridis]